MLNKTVSLFVLSGLLLSCSTHKKPRPMKMAKHQRVSNWPSMLKSSNSSFRRPAQVGVLPKGVEEFIKAVKSHPEVFEVPVGYEVKTEYMFYENDQKYPTVEKVIYLKQNKFGHFLLKKEDSETVFGLQGFDMADIHSFEQSIREMKDLKEAKKMSANKWRLIMPDQEDRDQICGVDLDLSKSIEISEKACSKDGKLVSHQKVLAVKKVNLALLREDLKAKKITVFPQILSCDSDTGMESAYCSITDGEEKDWSFLVTE